MAYTPSAATEAALAKSRNMYKTGEKLSPAEQALITAHSKALFADMAPQAVTGGGGPYDYNSGQTGGYSGYGGGASTGGGTGSNSVTGTDGQRYFLPDNQATLYDKYQNFIRTETEHRAGGLAPRPLPGEFTQFLGQQNPLGYTGNGDTAAPLKSPALMNSAGVKVNAESVLSPSQMSSLGMSGVYKSQPMLPSTPFQGYNPSPAVNAPLASATPGTAPAVVNSGAPGMNTNANTPSAPQTIHTSNGGLALGNSVAGADEGKLLAEAELQKQLRGTTNDNQTSGRKAMLEELSGVLQKQQAGAMSDMMPGVYEDLNTRGLLRSSALGEKVGLEASKLTRQTSEQLALQGIQDRNKSIDNIGTIEEGYLGARGTALQRRFSLEDFDRQVAAGEKLGANALPQISQPSGKGAGALQGALGGATIGAQVGGGPGAIAGGAIGLIGGGKLGGK